MPARRFHTVRIDLADPTPTGPATPPLFPWWSVTKTAIAICALYMADAGRLNLDAGLPGKPWSLRQLLQHRAGIPDYGSLPAYHQAVARNDPPWSRAQLLTAVDQGCQYVPPDRTWQYSNVGYLFARTHIEDVSGTGLADLVTGCISAPLGLQSLALASTPQDFARLHWPAARDYHPGWVYHGCLTGSAADAAQMLRALFAGAILSPASLAMMRQAIPLGGPLPGRPWASTGYCLGLMSGATAQAGRMIGHSGAGPFCVNALYHFPDLPDAPTVACFTDGTDEGLAETEAVRTALVVPA